MERMHTPMQDGDESKLNGLLAAYRDACPDPETNAEFMPKLWAKIEARRVDTTLIFRRLAHACMAATVALGLLTAFLTPATQDDETLYSSNYADVLADDHAVQAYAEALPADVLGDLR